MSKNHGLLHASHMEDTEQEPYTSEKIILWELSYVAKNIMKSSKN